MYILYSDCLQAPGEREAVLLLQGPGASDAGRELRAGPGPLPRHHRAVLVTAHHALPGTVKRDKQSIPNCSSIKSVLMLRTAGLD